MVDMRLVLCVLLLTTIVVTGARAERNWMSFRPQAFAAPEGRDYVIAVGTHDSLETVNASAIEDALKKGKEIRLNHAKIEGDVMFHGEVKKDVYFISSKLSGMADFRDAKFSGEVDFTAAKFSGEADFGGAEFPGGAIFRNATFSGDAFFNGARFSQMALFGYAEFSREANFWNAAFSGGAEFGRATFSGEVASFGAVEFSGEAIFRSATFSGDAYFVGARFSQMAFFEYTTFSGEVRFWNATFSGGAEFESVFEGKADFSRTRFLKDFHLNLAEFRESGSLSLENSVYPNIYVNLPDDPGKVPTFLNLNNPDDDPKRVEDTYFRLLKNQRDLGRPDKSLYIAMKRHQRKQKFLPVRWLEWCLFDFPTQYGTGSFPPKGMIMYITIVLVVFTASYYGINAYLRRSRGVEILERHDTDGGEAKCQKKLGRWEIVWFSLNTFIPAVHFVNMQYWRITDDRFLRIKCSTLATVESILGWLLIPILLRYFRI